jgi:hypothetical protein
MELKLHTFLGEDLKNSGWAASVGNTVSRPYQYAFGGRTVDVISSEPLTEVKTVWNDFGNWHIVSGLVKTAAIIALLVPSILLTLCFKGLSYLLTSKPSEDDKATASIQEVDHLSETSEIKDLKNNHENGTTTLNSIEELEKPEIRTVTPNNNREDGKNLDKKTDDIFKEILILGQDDNPVSEVPSTITGKTDLHKILNDPAQYPITNSENDRTIITTNIARDWFSVVLSNLDSIDTQLPLFIMAPNDAITPTAEMLNNDQLKRFPKVIFFGLSAIEGATTVESDEAALNDISDTKLFLIIQNRTTNTDDGEEKVEAVEEKQEVKAVEEKQEVEAVEEKQEVKAVEEKQEVKVVEENQEVATQSKEITSKNKSTARSQTKGRGSLHNRDGEKLFKK